MAEARAIKFLYTDRLYQVPAYGGQIIPKRGMVRVTWPILNFWASSDISETAKARVVKFYTQVEVDYIIV